MAKNYSRYYDSFEEMDKTLKQVDLTAILAVLLDLSFPFSNLGTFHPAFARTDDLAKVHALYMKNIKQIQTYL